MQRNLIHFTVKLLLASLILGLVFSLLGVDPWRYLGPLGALGGHAIKAGTTLFQWTWSYVVLGAALVVPAWLMYEVVTYLRTSPR